MNLCILSTMAGFSWGGSEFLWAEAARLAVQEGHQVTAVTGPLLKNSKTLKDLESLGVVLIHRPHGFDRRPIRAFERYIGTFPAISRRKPEVILISMGSALDTVHDLELLRFLDFYKLPYIVVCQHSFESHVLRREHRERALRFYRNARQVAFVAKKNYQSLEQQLAGAIPGGRIVLNPVNLATLEAAPWPTLAPLNFACVARLDANFKGQDLLFEVLGNDLWLERDWNLQIYGDGPHLDYLVELSKFHGIEGRTHFRGHVSDIAAIWRENHAALFPSRSEGTPLAMVESMICGRLAVVTDVGGNAEWIKEPETGFISKAPTANLFAAAMERAWAVRERWEEIGREARRVALERIDPIPGRTLLDIIVKI